MADEVQSGDVAPQVIDRKELLAEQFAEIAPVDKAEKPAKVSEDRPRDETGKFSAKTKEAAPAVIETATVVEPPLWDRPPASWKKENHDLWKGMDPRAREYAFQREEQMKAGVEPLLPKAQLADQITKVAEPYMNTIRGMNIDLPTAVRGLMEADNKLRTLPPDQKLQYLAGLARSYGIDLGAAAGIQQAQGPVDPNFYAIQNELNSVRGELQSWKQQQETAKEQTILGEINKFAKTADHFEEVRPDMIRLLQSGMAETIEDAYKKAIKLNDELSTQIQQATQAKAELEKRDTANRAAKAAKAAAVSVRSSTPGNQTPTKAQDRRSMLAEQLDSVSERL